MFVTITDRILNQIGIIELIFTAQYSKFDETEQDPYIFDKNGRSGIDGRYINWIEVWSNVELFNFQEYKQHFTERFERAADHRQLKNELAEIRDNAKRVADYYNRRLTTEIEIVKEFTENNQLQRSKGRFKDGIAKAEQHQAVAVISYYKMDGLYLGTRSLPAHFEIIKYPFRYLQNNYELAMFCERLLQFIKTMYPVRDATHREIILAYNYRVKAKTADFKRASEWEAEGGAKRKQLSYTLEPANKAKYKPPTKDELQKALDLLSDDPEARTLAEKDLHELLNS